MRDYVNQLGLTKSYAINGITTKAGSFSFSEDHEADLAWAGIGQSEDLVNPCSMMIYMGAIANRGRVVVPQIVSSVKTAGNFPLSIYLPKPRTKLISSNTAAILKAMMRNNVVNNYGEGGLSGYNLCAKSGTAEVGDGTSHAWFVGFLDSEENPYAFVVLVERGGSGAKVAGSVANTVLQAIVN
jgi:peptidoglycan glycosyltransferase